MQQLVRLTVSPFLLIVALASSGCGEAASTAPTITVSRISNWAMPAAGAKIPAPRGLAFDSNGDLFVLDDAGRILVFNPNGTVKHHWSMPESDVGNPEGICLFQDGRIGVADTHYHRVVLFYSDRNHEKKDREQGEQNGPVG